VRNIAPAVCPQPPPNFHCERHHEWRNQETLALKKPRRKESRRNEYYAYHSHHNTYHQKKKRSWRFGSLILVQGMSRCEERFQKQRPKYLDEEFDQNLEYQHGWSRRQRFQEKARPLR
jgi:hypothetical protein